MGEQMAPDGSGWDAVIVDVLERAKLCQPDELAAEVNAATRIIGVDVTVYLVDHEQERLWPLPERGKPTPPPLSLSGTVAGRAFTTVQSQPAREQEDPYRLWVPMVDGAARMGVADVVAHVTPGDPEMFRRRCETLIGLLGHLVAVKLPYGDTLQRVRRTRPLSASGELLMQMLPPLTFSCHRMTVSGVLEPAYDVGGDAFDYAVDGMTARVMVLDAMGRGLQASLTSAATLAAIRAARRDDRSLYEMARAADAALLEQFPSLRFVTGVLAELDMDTGSLRYINAGHPPPMLMRNGRFVRNLTGGRRMPLGLDDATTQVGEEILEPGDQLLLYTDGVTEAYDMHGERFGPERLRDLTERCMAAEMPSPETLRRLAHSVIHHQNGHPADDATLLLLEWSREAAERTQP